MRFHWVSLDLKLIFRLQLSVPSQNERLFMSVSLPRVASSIYVDCKKCERGGSFCRVVAHVSPSTCQTQCETCKKKKKYSLESPKASTSSSARSTTVRTGQVGRKPTVNKNPYDDLINQYGHQLEPYNIRTKYSKNSAIQHPKFGRGVVIEATSSKISVAFIDQVRELIHAKV